VNIGLPIAEHRTSYFVDDLTVGVIDERDLPVERRARTRLRSVTASPLVPVQRALERGVLSPRLPRPLLQAIASVRQLAEPRAAQRHIQRTWLARMTASGLEPPPAAASVRALRDEEMVQLAPGASLRWAASLDDRGQPILLCTGNGHAIELTTGRSTALEKLLLRLISGAPLPLAALARPFPRPAQRRAARALLEQLVSFRVLRCTQ
jgi:50S ribosomal protein L16 3-hydroxylase